MHLDARTHDTALVDNLERPPAKDRKARLGRGKQWRTFAEEHQDEDGIQKR